jgi:hypothetical protein
MPKKARDPNQPKRPQSAYFLWMNENRPTIKAANPEASIGELGKIMGKAWGALTDAEKEPYKEQQLALKEEYDEAMKNFVPTEGWEDAGPKKKKQKDPNMPKRPLSAYFIWMNDVRAAMKEKNPEASTGELGKLMGAAWNALSDDEKAPFQEKQAELKAQYDIDMAAYNGGEE